MIEITIKGATPDELRSEIAYLAMQFQAPEVIAQTKAVIDAEKAVTKAKKNTVAPVAAPTEPAAEAPPPSEATVSAVPTIAELMALAGAKSKIVGSEKVKEKIASFGAATIKQLDPSKLPELKVALEALS